MRRGNLRAIILVVPFGTKAHSSRERRKSQQKEATTLVWGWAVDKVARASSPARPAGVPPDDAPATGGGTPPKPAGEDACATLCHWPCVVPSTLSFFPVDIPALKPIISSMCIGTHSTVAGGQAFPHGGFPPALRGFFHYSPFKIPNSHAACSFLWEGRAPASPKYWGVAALRPPALTRFFRHSPFRIRNSLPVPIKVNQGQSR